MSDNHNKLPRCLFNFKSREEWTQKFVKDIYTTSAELENENDFYGKDSGLHISYQSFLRFFAAKQPPYKIDDLIVAAQFSYGWMPTINKMQGDPFTALEGFHYLVESKFISNGEVNIIQENFKKLLPLMNNSLVGVSKLLHFAKPEVFAIWDSQVYRYFYSGRSMHGLELKNFDRYLQYHKILNELSRTTELKVPLEVLRNSLTKAVPERFRENIIISNNRCFEFVMYSSAKRESDSTKVMLN